jgi:hypothetical protein
MLATAVLVLLIDLKTKREILMGANMAHDDLEKFGALSGLVIPGKRGADNPASNARFASPDNGSVRLGTPSEMEKGSPVEASNGQDSGCEGSGLELPKRRRGNANPTIPPGGKRVGSRTNPKVPREETP